MITATQLLPTLYHLQHQGLIGPIRIADRLARTLDKLRRDAPLAAGFPGQSFEAFPNAARAGADADDPGIFRKVIADMPPRNLVVVAVPDHLHHEVILHALRHDQHVLTVKPLVLRHAQAAEIEREARRRGLLVGIEYHKRFDTRSLMARQEYRAGRLGQFRAGQAHLVECWYYRRGNFQNWCTCENSDAFTYIGCHYVDLVHFITALLPRSVSVHGVVGRYPNGREGYLWTDGRVTWQNGAFLSVLNGLGYPDAAPGGNSQGMTLFCEGERDGCLIRHSDQYRGVAYSFTQAGSDPGDTVYAEPNADYFRLLDLGDGRLTPTGYGHRSVEAIIEAARRVEAEGGDDLPRRQALLAEIDRAGILATPANSAYNELVIEAARLSLANNGREVLIEYEPQPGVRLA